MTELLTGSEIEKRVEKRVEKGAGTGSNLGPGVGDESAVRRPGVRQGRAEHPTGPTSDAVEILRRMFGGDPVEDAIRMNEVQAENEAGRALFALRESAGLTEAELAARLGVAVEVIEQAEIGDHEDGHWLALLRRAAAACGKRMEIRFEPADPADADPTPSP